MNKTDRYYERENRIKLEKAKSEAAARKVKDEEMWAKIRDVILKIIPKLLAAAEKNLPPAHKTRWLKYSIYHLYYIIPWLWGGENQNVDHKMDKLKAKYYKSYAWPITSCISLTTKGMLIRYDDFLNRYYYIDLEDKKFLFYSHDPYYNSTMYSGNPNTLRELCQDLINGAKTFGISNEYINSFQKELDEIR